MAEVGAATGAIGVVAAALGWAHTTYLLMSRIKHAPEEVSNLAGHIHALQKFLEAFQVNLGKSCVMSRSQNLHYLPSIVDTVTNFAHFLSFLDAELNEYNCPPVWTSRVKWALAKPKVLDLEHGLMSRLAALNSVLMCMNLFVHDRHYLIHH